MTEFKSTLSMTYLSLFGSLKASIPKTYFFTNSNYPVSWVLEDAMLEEVITTKYLGVSISVRGRNMVGLYEMLAMAHSYAYTIMNLTRKGLPLLEPYGSPVQSLLSYIALRPW